MYSEAKHQNMAATSKLEAVVKAKCPKCRRGNIFSGPMYGIKLQKTNERCSNCHFRFEMEPGYFYAAMFVSYALNVAEIVAVAIITYLILGTMEYEDIWIYLASIVGATIILAPFNYRYSRVLLLHYLSPKVKYDPSLDK